MPLWLTLERPDALGEDHAIIGWPSYMRQDKADANAAPLKRDFDIRLVAYNEDWREIPTRRRDVQVKSLTSPANYDPSVIVAFMWQIADIKKPAEAVSLAASLGRLSDDLYMTRLRKVQQFASSFIEKIDIGGDQELLAA
jgi:hypothetical protein